MQIPHRRLQLCLIAPVNVHPDHATDLIVRAHGIGKLVTRTDCFRVVCVGRFDNALSFGEHPLADRGQMLVPWRLFREKCNRRK